MKGQDWVRGVERLLFPRDICCAWCGAERGLRPCGLCEDCLNQLPWNDTPAVREGVICPAPLRYEEQAKRMIHALKFEGRRYLAEPLGRLMAECLRDVEADGLIPVPLHPTRYRDRGFNQSELLCQAISQELSIPVWHTALQRVRDTRHQIGLSAAERRENVKGAFQADACVAGKTLILVDDVFTTGATFAACVQELRDKKAVVRGVAAARVCEPSADAS